MIKNHPVDSKRTDNPTEPFWEDKRFPDPLKLSYESHDSPAYQFVLNMALLFSEAFLIDLPTQDIIHKVVEEKLSLEVDEDFSAGSLS